MVTWICIECLVFLDEGEGDLQKGRIRLCVGVAVWQSEQVLHFFFSLVLGKKIVFLKSYSGGKPQFPPTRWNRILIFALGKRRLVTFLKTSTFNVWLMAGHRSIIFFF